MKSNKIRTVWFSIWAVVVALVITLTIFLTNYAMRWDRALGGYFGYTGGKASEYQDMTKDELKEAEKQCSLDIVDEGAVLLQNDDNALPLNKGAKVSVFGQTAYMWMTKEKITNTIDTVLTESLQAAGLEINTTLRKFYRTSNHKNWGTGANLGNGGIAGTWKIDEVPQSEFTSEVKNSYDSFGDAAIVVFSRSGSEGGDLPRYMGRFGGSDDEHYLELSSDEKALLAAIEASGSFKKTIVILHTGNAMQMDFTSVAEYGVDAVLWISGTGQDGVSEIGKLLVGDVNPSGKNVDTYVYDNFSSPTIQNFGDYRFTQDGELINATTTNVGGTYSYINYGESIYMGYRYYETRYEDAVMGADNVGEYKYADTVYAPFGYGLSYTEFEWSDFNVSAPDKDGNITASLTVKNIGKQSGKDVVEFYYQSPYTAYDRANGVEKASVELIDFAKTPLLKAGESKKVEVKFSLYDMASYDSVGAKTYILDEGTYYITAAGDAHSAINNVLSAKNYSTVNGMTDNGNADFVFKYELKEFTKCDTSAAGTEITNQFSDCLLDDAQYLSRTNWSQMDAYNRATMLGGVAYATSTSELGLNEKSSKYSVTMDEKGRVGVHEASSEIIEQLTTEGWDRSGNPVGMNDQSWTKVKFDSTDTSLSLGDLDGVLLSDVRWSELISQASKASILDIIGRAMNGTAAVEAVGKPESWYMDGPQGLINYMNTENKGYQFQDEGVLGATWNKELASLEGELCSSEFAMEGVSAWWAPAMNLHRSPFSGRNFEYFSEDGIHSGLMALEMVKAAQANGVVTQLKHVFMNDQETNRGANGRVATFASEQTMRELYLEPYRICIEDGGAMGVMCSMSRIGTTCAPCSYNLLTNVLRKELGLVGAAITDAQSFTLLEAEQALAAGCDLVDAASTTKYLDSTINSPGGEYMIQQAGKNILYITLNSNAFGNGMAKGYPIYKIILIVSYLVIAVYLLYGTGEIALKLYPEQKVITKKAVWVIRAVLWAIAAVLLIYLAIMFFSEWLPMLKFAFQTV